MTYFVSWRLPWESKKRRFRVDTKQCKLVRKNQRRYKIPKLEVRENDAWVPYPSVVNVVDRYTCTEYTAWFTLRDGTVRLHEGDFGAFDIGFVTRAKEAGLLTKNIYR